MLDFDNQPITASEKGDVNGAQLALNAGADVHANNDEALRLAAMHGHAEGVRMLLAAGADVRASNNAALHLAICRNHTEIVRMLLAAGADVNDRNPLGWGTMTSSLTIVRPLLAAGADVHAHDDMPLRNAAFAGRGDVIGLLLASGADVHARNDDALYMAAKSGYVDVVDALLGAGASTDADHGAALRAAAARGHVDVTRRLLMAHADPIVALQQATPNERNIVAMTLDACVDAMTPDQWAAFVPLSKPCLYHQLPRPQPVVAPPRQNHNLSRPHALFVNKADKHGPNDWSRCALPSWPRNVISHCADEISVIGGVTGRPPQLVLSCQNGRPQLSAHCRRRDRAGRIDSDGR